MASFMTDISADPSDYDRAPEGWVLRVHENSFSGRAGPFYFRTDGVRPGVGFFSKEHHGNLNDMVHGGALMTLADMALFTICYERLEGDMAVTVTLNSEFLGAGPIGKFIEASGEVTRAGRSLIFARGMVECEGKSLLAFSGILKRVQRRV